MIKVRIENLTPDMIVARNIYSSDGRILLHAGIKLNENYINRLKNLGIISVYIKDEFDDELNLEIREPVSEETRAETIKEVKNAFEALEQNRSMNTRMVKSMVNKILDEILDNHDILINLCDIRTFDDYTFGHSVNVCILSIMAGITMGYHDLKLKELGIGALLHDIGKVYLDPAVLNKPDDLTREEYAEVKRHTEYGFEILRKYPDIPLLAAHIAFQHHERWDGQGYPRGLAGEDIHEYARIVAVADVYDALLSDRPYRPSYTINQAITILNRMSGIYLDPKCITALVANIAVYPIGTIVELNTGDIGIVVDVNKSAPTRPILKMIYNKTTNRLYRPYEVDLSKLTTVIITRSLTREELGEILKN
ncbi:HD-GYP domain-containing protein [Thermosyntropha sp.]|uniref:HD-GYP domain-containing protein n=1 Tax=Thermosyntropha sp. TaxID=2740820 RepID=UPI0025CF1C5E|nr:HD-GYP domain-containing protein [Thermosyntropha sp.]MBO8158094.1 HD-GYP domain-containing protein [Thermosyntropha sp.]